MRLPNKVTICGIDYKVIKHKDTGGGWFSNREIHIGIRKGYNNPMETFLHEVIEIILAERNLRYQLPYNKTENGHYIFVFNHHELENLIKDIAKGLEGVMK